MASILKQYKVVDRENRASKLFESLFGNMSFIDVHYQGPYEYVKKYWAKYLALRENSYIDRKMFELIIATLFIREGLLPLYRHAKVSLVPNIEFDFLLYSKESGPLAFWLQPSLSVGYKKVDLEAIALKYSHLKSKGYLMILEEQECFFVNEKIRKGEMIGIDHAILCSSKELDQLIRDLKKYDFSLAGNIDIIESKNILTPALIH